MNYQNDDRHVAVADLDDVLNKIGELASKSGDGNYLYRGEPDCFPTVSSGLFREYHEIDIKDFDVSVVQGAILEDAKRFVGGNIDDDELLDRLQHYGHRTNLIDFTTDSHIALFFACDGRPEKDGRVILLDEHTYPVRTPKFPENRVIAQKSVFVQPPKGYVDPDVIVHIPRDLKHPMLSYLRRSHDVSEATLYNDLHGFISYRRLHRSFYEELYVALVYSMRKEYDQAIEHNDIAINLNPNLYEAYNNRGLDYRFKGELSRAIDDYDKAIELSPRYAMAYCNRGVVYAHMSEFDRAIKDFNMAIQLDPKHVDAHNNRGNAYRAKGEHDRAISDYGRAIQLDPNHVEALNNRGGAYGEKGCYERAIADFDQAIRIDPNSAEAYNNRGEASLGLKDWSAARSDFSVAMKLGADIVSGFARDYGSVAAYEQKFDVRLPEDIRALLAG